MKRVVFLLLMLAMLVAGCSGGGDADVTETTDTAVAEDDRDLATRVGDTVGTATANADEMRQEGNERVDEVNEAMEE